MPPKRTRQKNSRLALHTERREEARCPHLQPRSLWSSIPMEIIDLIICHLKQDEAKPLALTNRVLFNAIRRQYPFFKHITLYPKTLRTLKPILRSPHRNIPRHIHTLTIYETPGFVESEPKKRWIKSVIPFISKAFDSIQVLKFEHVQGGNTIGDALLVKMFEELMTKVSPRKVNFTECVFYDFEPNILMRILTKSPSIEGLGLMGVGCDASYSWRSQIIDPDIRLISPLSSLTVLDSDYADLVFPWLVRTHSEMVRTSLKSLQISLFNTGETDMTGFLCRAVSLEELAVHMPSVDSLYETFGLTRRPIPRHSIHSLVLQTYSLLESPRLDELFCSVSLPHLRTVRILYYKLGSQIWWKENTSEYVMWRDNAEIETRFAACECFERSKERGISVTITCRDIVTCKDIRHHN